MAVCIGARMQVQLGRLSLTSLVFNQRGSSTKPAPPSRSPPTGRFPSKSGLEQLILYFSMHSISCWQRPPEAPFQNAKQPSQTWPPPNWPRSFKKWAGAADTTRSTQKGQGHTKKSLSQKTHTHTHTLSTHTHTKALKNRPSKNRPSKNRPSTKTIKPRV
jgi:hypothetical protein